MAGQQAKARIRAHIGASLKRAQSSAETIFIRSPRLWGENRAVDEGRALPVIGRRVLSCALFLSPAESLLLTNKTGLLA
jgi:hypothetical protein